MSSQKKKEIKNVFYILSFKKIRGFFLLLSKMKQFGGSEMRGGGPTIFFPMLYHEGYNTSTWIFNVGNVICAPEV